MRRLSATLLFMRWPPELANILRQSAVPFVPADWLRTVSPRIPASLKKHFRTTSGVIIAPPTERQAAPRITTR